MTPGEIIMAAYKQQQLTGRKNADVAIFVRGSWSDGGKRINGRSSPLGQCMAEYEDGCLCLFNAAELITYSAKLLPTIEASDLLRTDEKG